MKANNYKDFLDYILSILKDDVDKLLKQKNDPSIAANDSELSYLKGQLFAYFHLYRLLKSECFHFNISEKDLNLDIINEYDLLAK